MPATGLSKKKALIIIAVIAILSLILAVFVFFYQPEEWDSVASWNGQTTDVAMTTEPFTITGVEWRVNWHISSYSDTAQCNIFIYDGNTSVLIEGLNPAVPVQSGEVRLNITGRFYITIGINGTFNSWAVQVFERA